MKRRYQIGGEVEADDEEFQEGDFGLFDPAGGATGALDPTTAMLTYLTQQGTISGEGLATSQDILSELRRRLEEDATGKSLRERQRAQTAKVRQALENARQRLLAQDFNRGDALLAVSSALSKPTQFGSVGEAMGNVSEALRGPIAERREFERGRDLDLSKLETEMAGLDAAEIEMDLALEEINRRGQYDLAEVALRNIGRPLTSGQNVPNAAARALDSAYAPEYLTFRSGGADRAAIGLEVLRGARDALRSGRTSLTGPIPGGIQSIPGVGRWLGAAFFPPSANLRDLVEQTIQNDLRPVLGSQFTEREGERLIARTFNVNLQEPENAARLDALIRQLEGALESKKALAEHYRRFGTVSNFDGPIFYTADSFGFGETPSVDINADPTNEMSEYARRSLLPGSMILKPEDQLGRAKGGRVRYQGGGEVVLSEEEEDEDFGLWSRLKELHDEAGFIPNAVMGGVAGLSLEPIANRLLRLGMTAGKGGERFLSRSMELGGLDPTEEVTRIKRQRRLGVPSQLMDIESPPVRVLAERALEHGGPEADAALDALRDRVAGSRERVDTQISKGLKPYDYFEHDRKLAQQAENERRQLMKPVFDQYEGIAMDPVLKAIMDTPEGNKALQWAFRFYENVPGRKIGKEDLQGMVQKPSLEFYDYVRRGFDEIIERQEKGGRTEFSGVLRDLRQQYLDRLDQLAPEYRAARQQQIGTLETRDALESGRNFRRLEPQQLAELAKKMPFHERNAYRTGMAQTLFEMLDKPSAEGFNAAQRIIGSPELTEKLRPFFDSPREFDIFQAALEAEARLARSGSKLASRGENLRLTRERGRQSSAEYLAQRGPGFRFSISLPGWALRIFRDMPQMTEGQAKKVLEVIQRGDPKELDRFARTARKLRLLGRTRAPRLGAAALIGAGTGALMTDAPQE
jgi:hypothetical protein